MIFNKQLDRITKVELVQNFMMTHQMRGGMCDIGDDHFFLLCRLPYAVAFWDALAENYLEIVLIDFDADLLIEGSSALGCSLDMGFQTIETLRSRSFAKHPLNEIFLSANAEKMRYLHSHLEAIDKLLPLLEKRGGLSSMRCGGFTRDFDFVDSVKPIYPGLKERLMDCISRFQ